MNWGIFDKDVCQLGEGPFWHPERQALFWFDILAQKLKCRDANGACEWTFDAPVSAAGWIDRDRLLVASARELFRFEIATGTRDHVSPLEADNPGTRSNDGRADPMGGFWIGTMGLEAEAAAGAIYRYHGGRLHKLFDQITIPNAICFAPGGRRAFFADTPTRKVMQVALDPDGWPEGEPSVFVDLSAEGLNPDGAVIDADGVMWLAQWGAAQVAAYSPDGRFLRAVALPAHQVTCPAFGGSDYRTLHVTSATQGIDPETLAAAPEQGMTFCVQDIATGTPEPRVKL